jgi:transposase
MVGDRGMITGKHIQHFQENDTGVSWITAMKSQSLRKLVEDGAIQPSLFDEANLFEFTHADYPGERLIACRNPVLGRKRAHKRDSLLEATVRDLEKIQKRVVRGSLSGREKIGLKVGEKLGKHHMGKHFHLTITDRSFEFTINQESVEREALMDGIYVIRTNVSEQNLSSEDAVRAYKNLKVVERAFRTMKSVDLQVRPIHHRLPDRVKTHLFICMLAYYVRWHMEQAWASITFKDEHAPEASDPVAPAARSTEATHKAQTGTLPNGDPARTFKTVLNDLGTITRNACTHPESGATFELTTSPNAVQQKAVDLLKTITL